jgi:multidrug efflux system membrane fusion protein
MLDVRKNAIVVPLAAIQRGTEGSYVYTVKNGHANFQPVKVDLTQGNISLIATGIKEGDQVVVDGQDRLQAGSAVEVHSASPGGSGGAPADASGQGANGGGAKRGGKPEGDAGKQGGPGKDSGKRDPSKYKKSDNQG